MEVRRAYLESLVVAGTLLRDPALEPSWSMASALRGYSVGSLAGHLVRTVAVTEEHRRAAPAPDDVRRLTASEYYVIARPGPDPDDEINRAIMARAASTAADGPVALRAVFDDAVAALAEGIPHEPQERAIAVPGGLAMLLDEYLVTRIVELAVHLDDLAVSVALPTPELSPVARACTLGCLLALSRDLHGDTAVIRAFTRRERDDVDALHVL